MARSLDSCLKHIYVKDVEEDELIIDGDEHLVEDADTAIVWNPNTLKTISKIAIKCMVPSLTRRKKTLDLVGELSRILGRSLLERTMSSNDEVTVNEANADVSNLSIESHGADDGDASPCWLCNRNMANKLKCSEGHEICGPCAGEYILNHFGQDNSSSSSSMYFGCCISGCKSKPFCDQDLCRILSPEAWKVYELKRNHNEQLRKVWSLLKTMQRGIEENQGMLKGLSDQLTRSVMALRVLTIECSDLCPNLVWMVPSDGAKFRQDPKKWFLQKTFKQTYKVAFICQHSWEFAHKAFEISVPRDWVVKVASFLEIGLKVLRAVAASQGLSLPSLDMTKFRQDVQVMKELVDSVIPDSERARIANAVGEAGDGQTQQDMLLKDGDVCNLVEDGLKWIISE